jgi:hypothetical protein
MANQAAANALAQANTNSIVQATSAGILLQNSIDTAAITLQNSIDTGAITLQAANNTAMLAAAIRNDGDLTRGLIIAQNDTYLNRIILEQSNALIELRSTHNNHLRARETEVNVTQTVNQAQAQTQQQQQQQQQFQLLAGITSALNGLTQVAHATNQNVIAGNTGAVQTGAQSANPVNVA